MCSFSFQKVDLLGRDYCTKNCTVLLAVLQVLIVEFSSVTGLSGDIGRGPNSVIISCVCDLYSSAFEILLV